MLQPLHTAALGAQPAARQFGDDSQARDAGGAESACLREAVEDIALVALCRSGGERSGGLLG